MKLHGAYLSFAAVLVLFGSAVLARDGKEAPTIRRDGMILRAREYNDGSNGLVLGVSLEERSGDVSRNDDHLDTIEETKSTHKKDCKDKKKGSKFKHHDHSPRKKHRKHKNRHPHAHHHHHSKHNESDTSFNASQPHQKQDDQGGKKQKQKAQQVTEASSPQGGGGLRGKTYNGSCPSPNACKESPNGDIKFLNCGLDSGSGWQPPNVKMDDLSMVEPEIACKGEVFKPCERYLSHFKRVAAQHNIHATILMAFAMQESHCDAGLTGPNGEIGMMQIIPANCRGDCWDVESNIRLGAKEFSNTLNNSGGNVLLAIGSVSFTRQRKRR
jgi:hypothetical protein